VGGPIFSSMGQQKGKFHAERRARNKTSRVARDAGEARGQLKRRRRSHEWLPRKRTSDKKTTLKRKGGYRMRQFRCPVF